MNGRHTQLHRGRSRWYAAAVVAALVAAFTLAFWLTSHSQVRAEGSCVTVDNQLRDFLLEQRVHRAEVIQR